MRNGLTGKPQSCPDPSVINAHRDYNQATRAIPDHVFQKLSQPILKAGNGFLGPG